MDDFRAEAEPILELKQQPPVPYEEIRGHCSLGIYLAVEGTGEVSGPLLVLLEGFLEVWEESVSRA